MIILEDTLTRKEFDGSKYCCSCYVSRSGFMNKSCVSMFSGLPKVWGFIVLYIHFYSRYCPTTLQLPTFPSYTHPAISFGPFHVSRLRWVRYTFIRKRVSKNFKKIAQVRCLPFSGIWYRLKVITFCLLWFVLETFSWPTFHRSMPQHTHFTVSSQLLIF